MVPRLRSNLRPLRQRLGVQQRDLAKEIGVSRQTLSAIEAGTTVPSTQIALALSRALRCGVEDIFSLADEGKPLAARLVREDNDADATTSTSSRSARRLRVAMAQISGQWVARALDSDQLFAPGTPADGIATVPPGKARVASANIKPLRDREALARNLLVAGCDPALGLLGRHLEERSRGPRLHWIDLASRPALDQLAAQQVHVAGVHIDDLRMGNLNAVAVRERFGDKPMLLVTLATWELGIVYRPRAGLVIKDVADLARKGLRVIAREPGSGAAQLLDSALDRAGLSMADLSVVATAHGHRGVAQMVSSEVGDAGVATRSAAAPFGLGFTPLADSRFDLALPANSVSDERVHVMLDCLASGRFRKDLGAMIGYHANKTGDTVTGAQA